MVKVWLINEHCFFCGGNPYLDEDDPYQPVKVCLQCGRELEKVVPLSLKVKNIDYHRGK